MTSIMMIPEEEAAGKACEGANPRRSARSRWASSLVLIYRFMLEGKLLYTERSNLLRLLSKRQSACWRSNIP